MTRDSDRSGASRGACRDASRRDAIQFRLAKVQHDRCSEWDGGESFLVPLDWEEATAQHIVSEVVGEMIEDAKAVKASPLAPPWHPPYDAHPDKTVAEVKGLHLAQKSAYEDWKREHASLTRSFEERLAERGFIRLWEADEEQHGVFELSAYWGHAHGLTLNYGPPKRDALDD